MKRLLLVWLALAVALTVTVTTADAKFVPKVPGEGSTIDNNDPTGDDHPWGGEDQSIDRSGNDFQTRLRQPIITSGYPVIDILLRLFHKDLWLLETRQTNRSFAPVIRPDATPPRDFRTEEVNRFRRGGVK